ncbi:lysosomal acid glucosylceramidase-like [Oppia nitens]|uniref:lysosomal acid glucosylceramidase-like n=1 Tax=Oppia nitens TaxID=1686743 RepID=UPI0023DAF684|nr:lysosomal acid glucosylceramidase-like [Oppia nitens]
MYSITLIVLSTFILVNAKNPCVHRDYGKGGTVCVCNATYCDTFDKIEKTSSGIITRFESNKNGLRFDKSLLKFKKQLNSFTQNNGKTIQINRNKTLQEIIGFGGAFTDAAAINIFSLKPQLSQRIINDYYSSDGLSYTMGRIPIGGSDFSTHKYTYDDLDKREDLELKKFNLTNEDLKYKIPLVKLALNVSSTIKLFGSPWSAPAWMKTNNDIAGKGSLKGDAGGPYYRSWAQYIVKFLNSYKSNGIEFWGLTVQNEPIDGQIPGFPFNAMGYTAEQERDFIAKDLGPTLKAANYGINRLKLMIIDDNRSSVNKWANVILNDSSSAQFVSGIAFHWYMNAASPPTELDKTYQQFPNYFILATEACEGWSPFETVKVSLGDWGRAETYAYDIITDLQHYTSGWIDWNLALDTTGGPNWAKNFVDSPVIVNSTANEYYRQPMFYSLAHFTKFLEPLSRRIQTTDTGTDQLQTIAFVTPNQSVVVIVLNRLNDTIPLTLVDPELGSVETNVPPHSLQTYVWYK